MTPNDLITLALKQAGVVGVGQTPLAEDMNDAFALLNMMLGQWNRKRWLIYHELDVSFASTGALSYTIGPGGTSGYGVRPDRLESAYFRLVLQQANAGQVGDENSDFSSDLNSEVIPPGLSQGVDYPLQLIQSYEDYATLPLKSLGLTTQAWPSAIFYDPGFPLGTIYVWPVPGPQFEIHLILKEQLAQIPAITSQINLPAEYSEALLYNLAVRLWDHYGMPPKPQTLSLAKAALNTIRNTNTAIPLLDIPDALNSPGVYNVFSDSYT